MTGNTHTIQKEGFVILIAVLVSSLLISLGAFIASIAIKELSLSVSGRDSQVAFYAADAGIECALYQDLHVDDFASSTSDTGGSNTMNCNSTIVDIVPDPLLSNGSRGVSLFEVSFPENTGDDVELSPFARVRITKIDVGGVNDETIIESRGYNIKTTSSVKRVERALEVTY